MDFLIVVSTNHKKVIFSNRIEYEARKSGLTAIDPSTNSQKLISNNRSQYERQKMENPEIVLTTKAKNMIFANRNEYESYFCGANAFFKTVCISLPESFLRS